MNRGRPKLNEEKLLKYTQIFEDEDGNVTKWHYDKEKHPNGPYLVEIEEYISPELEKLIKERDKILKRYETPEGQRKKRITKVDKIKLEELNGKIEKKEI